MTDNGTTSIETDHATLHVSNRFGSGPEGSEVLCLSLRMNEGYDFVERGNAWTDMDANELRDAIDKAVGPRLTMTPAQRPYRPQDRDRLLRHIEDTEASLIRRNERWEKDQERIRDLGAEVDELRESLHLNTSAKTAREYLELAFKAATVPEDGMIHEGEISLIQFTDGWTLAGSPAPVKQVASEHTRLLDPRAEATEEDLYRKDLEGKGLSPWEIELLIEHVESVS